MRSIVTVWTIVLMALLAVILTSHYAPAPTHTSTASSVSSVAVAPTQRTPSTITPSTASTTILLLPAVSPQTVPMIQTTPTPVTKQATAPATTTTPPVPQVSTTTLQAELSASATRIRSALVNILCLTSASGGLKSISGSGVIISPNGVILTNAHIGQYFLLSNYPTHDSTSCTIRTGGPARNTYTAALMFISPAWLAENQTTILQAAPMGTGAHDIAFLIINGSLKNEVLPTTFPYVPLATRTPNIGDPVVIGSYAAQFLTVPEIESNLYPTIVYGNVQKIYTFATNTADLISLGGSVAAQEGSSGGGAIDTSGDLLGTITTSTTAGSTSARDLHAITAIYIRRDYAQEAGESLDTALQDPMRTAALFAPALQTLRADFTQALSAAQ